MTDFSDIKVGDKVLVGGCMTMGVVRVTRAQFVVQEGGLVRKFMKKNGNPCDGSSACAYVWTEEKEENVCKLMGW